MIAPLSHPGGGWKCLKNEALEVGRKCEQRYHADLGVKEDLIKNLADPARLGLLPGAGRERCARAIQRGMEYIRQK